MHGYDSDTVTKLETNLDDCSAEILGSVFENLFAAGALDAWFTPIQMKKHRPAVMLSVLCDESRVQAIADLIFTETTAFGLRMEKVLRLKLTRRFDEVVTDFGRIKVKLGLKGDRIVQFSPEFESCRAAADRAGVPVREVFAQALRARPGRS
jgi:pyridinium-3,5-bisthiocarboxylic acid mononucleotide nickel chelatase